MTALRPRPTLGSEILPATLAHLTATAAERDAQRPPTFPTDAFDALRDAGALRFNAIAGRTRPPAAEELTLVRAVAAADGSVGRIFDGHLNAVERLAVFAPPALRDAELAAVQAGELRCGVWGGDPRGDEGMPATVHETGAGETGLVLRGVKTFCSGAGGLQRAAVLARAPSAPQPLLVWVDLTDQRRLTIDDTWYRASGLVASVSHRVVFADLPVMAVFGPPGAIAAQPWFGRDALRTAASWAGMADTAVRAASAELAGRPEPGDLEALAAGRILAEQGTIDAWLSRAAVAMDAEDPGLGAIAVSGRYGIAQSARRLLNEAALACGSHPFARGSALDRARRDLELFLLQHRLEPLLARVGRSALKGAR